VVHTTKDRGDGERRGELRWRGLSRMKLRRDQRPNSSPAVPSR
jgi:hypothetical protein